MAGHNNTKSQLCILEYVVKNHNLFCEHKFMALIWGEIHKKNF